MQPETVNLSDETLVQRSQTGDAEALEQLITKYKDRLYNVVLRMCRNADDAAELTQESFVRIIENLDRFAGRSSFYTWAFRIAVNMTLNFCRRQSRAAISSLDLQISGNDEQAKAAMRSYLADTSVRDPAAVAANKEQLDLIIRAINELDTEQRAVIILRDIEDMDYSQIAQILDVELGTVKSRLSRARANLRENLEAIIR